MNWPTDNLLKRGNLQLFCLCFFGLGHNGIRAKRKRLISNIKMDQQPSDQFCLK